MGDSFMLPAQNSWSVPSRRHLLVFSTTSVSGALLAGCTIPLGSVPSIENQPCPPLNRLTAKEYVCSHIDTAAGIDLSVSPTSMSSSEADVDLSVTNNTDNSLGIKPWQWQLFRTAGFGLNKRDDPRIDHHSDTAVIEPGNTFTWGGLFESLPVRLYAAVITVWKGADFDGPEYRTGTAVDCVFLFRVRNG